MNYKEHLEDSVKLLRNYMERDMPQSFAAMYVRYEVYKKLCKLHGIEIDSYEDIEKYAKKEKIERFGFKMK